MLDNSTSEQGDERQEKDLVKPKKSVWKIVLIIILSIVGILLIGIGLLFAKYPPLAKAAYNFLIAPTDKIASEGGRVNILIMGKSGGNHDGADLTDTMILASVSLNTPGVKTVSIPRDIWIPELRSKINSAYYWGKTGTPYFDSNSVGGGLGLSKSVVKEISGETVQYGLIIDFSSFKEIVDTLGGIDVNVENGFTDKLYPIAGRENDTCGGRDPSYPCRYETITFNPGVQKMDGETALKFVRSRHAEGTEGTDIAREARQQKVITAIKNKVTDPKVFLSVRTDLAMLNLVNKYVETDLDLPTAGILARKVLDGGGNVHQNIIPEDLLIVPPAERAYDNLYVFIPKAGNGKWQDLQNWFSETLSF